MSRRNREYLPGAVFHIVARTQNREPWFAERLRGTIMRFMIEGVLSSDATLLALAVMPNHFHLVLRQAVRPLGWIMQPIMRRTALLVQRTTGIDGHIFARKFRTSHCDTPWYVRRSIAYTNLNPWRAALCHDPSDYPWTTHREMIRDGDPNIQAHLRFALELFAEAPGSDIHKLRYDYQRYIAWRMERDGRDPIDKIGNYDEPNALAGDAYFRDVFVPIQIARPKKKQDLRDRAADVLRGIERHADLDALRRAFGRREATRLRDQVIAALLQEDYRVKSIADFFRVSDSTIARISSAIRAAALEST